MPKVNVFWFRRDLRLEDNIGLFYALKDSVPVLPIFIFDKNILDDLDDRSDARVTFIHDQISKLCQELKSYGGSIKVYYDTPENAFDKLIKDYEVQGVYTNRDYEPYAEQRDARVARLLKKHNIDFYTFKDQVIFERGEILNDQDQPYKVFTPYKKRWLSRLTKNTVKPYGSHGLLENVFSLSYDPPSLSDMGFRKSSIDVPPKLLKISLVEKYGERRDFPAIDGTSRLGVHLRFGTLSIRAAVRFAQEHSEVWLNELIWREFYSMILAHFPHVVDRAFKPKYDNIPWTNDENQFQKWCDGMTGYPIVDAGMRELNATGYMHNRVRMVTASFLTKHLLIDWRWGEAYFASKLLDYDLASNNGGWQWAAGTGTDAQPYFRIFNPYSQQEKFDPDMVYIKKWVPEFESSEYSSPIVDHKVARLRAINTYKEAVS
ncbi:MAG: deoxyribodipyrimidine photo-lyase [Cyclobacteriaceae bacterium]